MASQDSTLCFLGRPRRRAARGRVAGLCRSSCVNWGSRWPSLISASGLLVLPPWFVGVGYLLRSLIFAKMDFPDLFPSPPFLYVGFWMSRDSKLSWSQIYQTTFLVLCFAFFKKSATIKVTSLPSFFLLLFTLTFIHLRMHGTGWRLSSVFLTLLEACFEYLASPHCLDEPNPLVRMERRAVLSSSVVFTLSASRRWSPLFS